MTSEQVVMLHSDGYVSFRQTGRRTNRTTKQTDIREQPVECAPAPDKLPNYRANQQTRRASERPEAFFRE